MRGLAYTSAARVAFPSLDASSPGRTWVGVRTRNGYNGYTYICPDCTGYGCPQCATDLVPKSVSAPGINKEGGVIADEARYIAVMIAKSMGKH